MGIAEPRVGNTTRSRVRGLLGGNHMGAHQDTPVGTGLRRQAWRCWGYRGGDRSWEGAQTSRKAQAQAAHREHIPFWEATVEKEGIRAFARGQVRADGEF